MNVIETKLPGVVIVEPQVFGDHRGWFMESWSQKTMADNGLNVNFVQDNQSYTARKGTLRGIHFQQYPMAQTKLVRVTRGAVMDVAVDLRKDSPTYRQWVAVELSAENKKQLLIPQGFGHAFLTLTDDVEFVYKCDNEKNVEISYRRGDVLEELSKYEEILELSKNQKIFSHPIVIEGRPHPINGFWIADREVFNNPIFQNTVHFHD